MRVEFLSSAFLSSYIQRHCILNLIELHEVLTKISRKFYLLHILGLFSLSQHTTPQHNVSETDSKCPKRCVLRCGVVCCDQGKSPKMFK